MDSLNATTGWQANLAGTALAATGLLHCVWGLYAAGRYMGDALHVACFALGTVLAVWRRRHA